MDDEKKISDKEDEEKEPSVNVAYEFALRSYDWAIRRSDTVDAGVDRLLPWCSSINLGIILLAANKNIPASFCSIWFIFAVALFLLFVWLGFLTKKGSLTLIDPATLEEHWIKHSEWVFKRSMIRWSGRHFKENSALINKRGKLAEWMYKVFLLNLFSLGLWIILAFQA